MIRFIFQILWFPLLCILLWSIGLLWFIHTIPTEPTQDESQTDAIVVLTGGKSRLDDGLALLAQGKAKKLFISGVARGVGVVALLKSAEKNWDIPQDAVIVLGHEATDTRGNAKETAEWVEREHFMRIRLVTANYHLPRSLFEFQRVMPGVAIIPNPVFPADFLIEDWWNHPGTFRLILLEYHKYCAIRLHDLLVRFHLLPPA